MNVALSGSKGTQPVMALVALGGCLLLLAGDAAAAQEHSSAAPAQLPPVAAPLPTKLDTAAGDPAKPHHFACHAGKGMNQTGTLRLTDKPMSVSGTFQLVEGHTEHGGGIRAGVRFLEEDGSDKSAGFLGVVPMNSTKTLVFYIVRGDYSERFAILSATQAPIPFVIRLTEPDRLKVTVAGVSKSLAVSPLPNARLMMECESADIDFMNVTLSR